MDTPDSMDPADDISQDSFDAPDYVDSPGSDRNPSPPSEFADHPEMLMAESIGNTAFSKHWLFTTLIKLIEEVDRENEVEINLAVDVDEDLQNELCKLWDMSMNTDVVKFLEEFRAVEILSGTIEKSKAPRVIEICVGILGNMACEQSVCQTMSENHKFIELVLDMMETRDGPTLVEDTRLIATSLANTGARGPWIRAIQRSEEILDHLMFIFSSSTNCDLLKNTAGLVDTLLDLEPDLCVSWATIDFIQSLIEATDQIGSNHSDAMEVYLHIFQSFSTTESGVEALVAHIDKLEKKIIKYLNIVCEYEIVGLDGKNGPLSSALSVLNILLMSRPADKRAHLCKDETIIRILLKILEPLYPMLVKYREAEKTNSNEPITEQNNDHVTSNDQSETGNKNNNAKESTNGGKESETSGENHDKMDNGEVCEKRAGNPGKTALDEEEQEELCQLEVLYEVLSGFLLDYLSIALVDSTKSDFESDNTEKGVGSENNNTVTSDTEKEKLASESETLAKGDDSKKTEISAKENNSKEAETSAKGDDSKETDILTKEDNSKEPETSPKGDYSKETEILTKEDKSEEPETSAKGSNSMELSNDEPVQETAIIPTAEESQSGDLGENEAQGIVNYSDDDEESSRDSKCKTGPVIDCVPILTYLDDACSRWRLNNLGLTLKESDPGMKLFDKLVDLAELHDKERLLRILTDIQAGRIVTRAESSKEPLDENIL